MPIKPTYPGVYIQEERSGVQTISGVATSVAAVFGTAGKGPIGVPTRVFSFDGYEAVFGDDSAMGEMSTQMRQFYMNGGGTAWVTRLANGSKRADVVLRNEAGGDVLRVAALSAGLAGNQLQIEIDYDTPSPERTFNLTVFRRTLDANGSEVISDLESFQNLSMDPASGNHVVTAVNGKSGLVSVSGPTPTESEPDPPIAALPTNEGTSRSGLYFSSAIADVQATINAAVGVGPDPTVGRFNISISDSPAVQVQIGTVPATLAGIEDAFTDAIAQALQDNGIAGSASVSLQTLTLPNPDSQLLQITSPTGSVVITPASSNDIAVALHLGAASGGLEWDDYSVLRPAPTGITSKPHALPGTFDIANIHALANRVKNTLTGWTLTLADETVHTDATIAFANETDRLLANPAIIYPTGFQVEGSLAALSANLAVIAGNMGDHTNKEWDVDVHGLRLHLRPKSNSPALGLSATLRSTSNDIFADIFDATENVANVNGYKLGLAAGGSGSGPFVGAAVPGSDGNIPQPGDYDDAYQRLARDADIFNLLLLPRCQTPSGLQTDAQRAALWGAASAFARDRRAFLLVDPPSDANAWTDVNQATGTSGVPTLRAGVVTDHAALYWPRLRVNDATGATLVVDPAGTIAGLMARTDNSRGVWKAPAGIAATLTGVRGLERRITDPENGVTNLAAINTNRIFPQGVVSWGARTMAGFENSGEDDYRYVPVRRTALFIEESLYRGLKFAVFEPNAEPLWTQIRLAAGAFMNNLFRQGAFKGTKKDDAYFVLCDASTTTQNDINLGIVNVRVGFAPLKPAEFVVVTIKQMAGQIET